MIIEDSPRMYSKILPFIYKEIVFQVKHLMNKDLLFYSNKDDYSKEMIEIINKNSIKDIFPVCIDDSKIKIPSFVKLIPTIYLSKSKELIMKYYETIFNWLSECEKIFGFDLDGYGKIRIYGFLAERFMSYWFKKNTKSITIPIIFYDIRKDLN
mgnify:CR=1 FL=1